MELPIAFPCFPGAPLYVVTESTIALVPEQVIEREGFVAVSSTDVVLTGGGRVDDVNKHHHTNYNNINLQLQSSPITILQETEERSSISPLRDGQLLITSPVSDGILAVTLLPAVISSESFSANIQQQQQQFTNHSIINEKMEECIDMEPVTIHLDLRSSLVPEVVTAKAYEIEHNLIQLVLVDVSATIMTLHIAIEKDIANDNDTNDDNSNNNIRTLTPVPIKSMGGKRTVGSGGGTALDFRCWQVLSTQQPRLRSTMVTFLSHDLILLAINPSLTIANIGTEETEMWSLTRCLEDMKARSSGIRRLLSKGVDLITGKLDATVFDMSPVAALCTVDANVFSIHADGKVRHWMYQRHRDGIMPYAVFELPVHDLPDPETWIDEWNSVYLTANILKHNQMQFVLAIHIQCSQDLITDQDTSMTDSIRPNAPSRRHVLVTLAGPVDFINHEGHKSDPLTVPDNVTGLVGMRFDRASDRCQLRAMYRTSTDDISNIVVLYPPSQLSILSKDYLIVPPESTLDGLAAKELDRIKTLSFYSILDYEAMTSTEDVLHDIDVRFLQFLFRPVYPRGTGSVLSPSKTHIRSVLRKLGSTNNNNNETSNSSSVEVDVLHFLHQWRRHDEQEMKIFEASNSALIPSNTAMIPVADSNKEGTMTICAEVKAGLGNDDKEVQYIDWNNKDTGMLIDEPSIRRHEDRWRTLLILIFKEETSLRAPTCIYLANSKSDATIIVRSGCISVITDAIKESTHSMAMLDTVAMEFLYYLPRDKLCSISLRQAQAFAMESLARGNMALRPEDTRTLKGLFNEIVMDFTQLDSSGTLRKKMKILENVSVDNWMQAMSQAPLESSLPGLCLIRTSISPMKAPRRLVLGTTTRLAAAHLVVRAIDSTLNLCLGRFLTLCKLGHLRAADVAFHMYLHSLNVLVVGARMNPFPPVTNNINIRKPEFGQSDSVSPPMKRSKQSSLLNLPDKTIVLDTLLIQISQRFTTTDSNGSLVGVLSALGSAAMTNIFETSIQAISFNHLPSELGLLYLPSGEIDQHSASLALRLLAPTVALHFYNGSTQTSNSRIALLAQCLLLASRSESPKRKEKMVTRAISLLPFDSNEMEKSMLHLEILEDRINGHKDEFAGRRLLDYITYAVKQTESDDENYESLCSKLFNAALAAQDWEAAYSASLIHPDDAKKATNCKRFVRALVDTGFQSTLVDKCANVGRGADNFVNLNDLYSIAEETLLENGIRDIYDCSPETASDYFGALYSLYVSRGDWKGAAHALDMRLLQGLQALSKNKPCLSSEEQSNRERLAVDDIVLGAVGSVNAIAMVSDAEAYLLSGRKSLYPAIPSHALPDLGGIKHSREGDPFSSGFQSKEKNLEKYLSLSDLKVRAVKFNALSTLYLDDPPFAKVAYTSDETSNGEIIRKLFELGYYSDGLALAAAIDKCSDGKSQGSGYFRDQVFYLISTFLLPLANDATHNPPRPTIRQLEAGMDSIAESGQSPVVISGLRSRKAQELMRSELQIGAMNFIRLLILKYTDSENPLALEVAMMMLLPHCPASTLPAWLEQYLLFGSDKTDAPGLFARRRMQGMKGYLGDPAALLTLYTMRGMYKDACRVVHLVLAGTENNFRKHVSTSRLPEKGEIDMLPRRKIDLLWNLIELANESGQLMNADEVLLERTQMETSLSKYFGFLSISEMGSKSARCVSLM